jgi:hypothetical protein
MNQHNLKQNTELVKIPTLETLQEELAKTLILHLPKPKLGYKKSGLFVANKEIVFSLKLFHR